MTRTPYCLASARILAAGRTEDKSARTAGMRAQTDPPLLKRPMRFAKVRAWLGRIGR